MRLIRQGIDYPFSQPESPSGKADVVALAEREEPLTFEVRASEGTLSLATAKRVEAVDR